MSQQEATDKDVVRQYLNAFNDHDSEALAQLLATDVIEHGIHETLRGIDDILEFQQSHFEVFPDYSGRTEAIVAEEDLVAVRYTVSGTHSGAYRGIEPTGHTVEWTGMSMYRIENERIAEIWVEEDSLGLLERLEVVDPPAHLRL